MMLENPSRPIERNHADCPSKAAYWSPLLTKYPAVPAKATPTITFTIVLRKRMKYAQINPNIPADARYPGTSDASDHVPCQRSLSWVIERSWRAVPSSTPEIESCDFSSPTSLVATMTPLRSVRAWRLYVSTAALAAPRILSTSAGDVPTGNPATSALFSNFAPS